MEHRVSRKARKIAGQIVEETLTVTKMQYGWSKYGGARHGMEKTKGEWFCQACGSEQGPIMPQYMLSVDAQRREFVRVCSICKHIQLQGKIGYYQLIRLVRK